MRRKIKAATLILLVVGYFAADCWLYKFSKLRLADAILLDVPLRLGAIVLGVVVNGLVRGDDSTGYWPTPRKR